MVRVQKFTTIVDPSTALKVDRLQMRIGILKFGTWFSCRMNVELAPEKMTSQFLESSQQRALIRV